MDPITGAALIGAGSTILGGLFGSKSQSSANRTQIQLQREQNEWNLAQWQRENEYNLPVNQMKRLKDAGINPNLAYSNGTTLETTSASSPQSAPAPQIHPYLGWGDTINDAVRNYTHIISSKDAHDMQRTQMESERLRQMTENAKRLEMISRQAGLDLDNELKRRTMEDLVKLQSHQVIQAGKQVQLSEAQYNSEIMRQSLMDADGVIKDKQAQILAKELEKITHEATSAKWKSEQDRIRYLSEKYEYTLNKSGFSTKDPLYANMIRNMIDDPVYARYVILGLEGVGGAGNLIGNFIGGVGKGAGAFLKGLKGTKVYNHNHYGGNDFY